MILRDRSLMVFFHLFLVFPPCFCLKPSSKSSSYGELFLLTDNFITIVNLSCCRSLFQPIKFFIYDQPIRMRYLMDQTQQVFIVRLPLKGDFFHIIKISSRLRKILYLINSEGRSLQSSAWSILIFSQPTNFVFSLSLFDQIFYQGKIPEG